MLHIQLHLWLQVGVVDYTFIKPTLSYVLTNEEKKRFIQIIETLKTPTHYVSSFKKIIKDRDLKGMKSHDYHIMMQEILPLCMQHLMTKECKMVIIHLYRVFKRLCAKVVDPAMMGDLKKEMAITLALLEQEFLPSIFDVMTHLIIHLVEELELCGLVQTRWMYPIERYLKTLNGYVGNRAKPEGGMAKRYAIEEAVGFALNISWILQPQANIRCGMTKKTPPHLMRCWKVVGVHEL
jgi:hypothetical protein